MELACTEQELARWEQEAARLLRGLGLCPFRRGDRELCLLLALGAVCPERLPEGLGALYEETARRLGGSPQAVERGLRRNLNRLWRKGDPLLLRRWFARLEGGRCPGNGAFLTVLVRKLREQRRPG